MQLGRPNWENEVIPMPEDMYSAFTSHGWFNDGKRWGYILAEDQTHIPFHNYKVPRAAEMPLLYEENN